MTFRYNSGRHEIGLIRSRVCDVRNFWRESSRVDMGDNEFYVRRKFDYADLDVDQLNAGHPSARLVVCHAHCITHCFDLRLYLLCDDEEWYLVKPLFD